MRLPDLVDLPVETTSSSPPVIVREPARWNGLVMLVVDAIMTSSDHTPRTWLVSRASAPGTTTAAPMTHREEGVVPPAHRGR